MQVELDSRTETAIDGRQVRAAAFQRVRLRYVEQTVSAREHAGRTALVVGGGRGLLARGLAGLGFDVLSIDPSVTATAMATERATLEGLPIEHRAAPAEELGVEAGHYDLVYLADTLEITPRLDEVLARAASALRPDGLLFYDTVNRTALSRAIYLGAFQRVPGTRIVPPGRYAAARLRRPRALVAELERHGFANLDICAFKPTDPAALVRSVRALHRGEITNDDVGERVEFVLDPEGAPVVTYLGHAVRR